MEKIRAVQDAATEPWVALFGEFLADVFPDRRIPGGAPFNVACHLAEFGVRSALASRLGKDPLGDELRIALADSRVDGGLMQVDALRGSGRVEVIATADGHRFEIPPGQAFDHIDGRQLIASLSLRRAPPAMLYFGTLAQREPTSRGALDALLACSDAPRFVDLNLRPPWVDDEAIDRSLTAADMVKLGEDELADVARRMGIGAPGDVLEESGRRLQERFGLAMLVVTRGTSGAWCRCGKDELAVPAAAVEPGQGDAVGAGDAFSAVCMLGRLQGWPLATMLRRAAEFAAAVCGTRGAVPAHATYERFRRDWMA